MTKRTVTICALCVLMLGLGAATSLAGDLYVPGEYATIQLAVDAAVGSDVIHVAAGTYTEQVHITTSDISIDGAGVGSTVIASPVTLTAFFTTSGPNDNYPVVFVDGATGVALSNLTVDGVNQGDTNYRFIGVGFWNGGGSMTDMDVLNVMNSTFSGAQHGVGVYSYNDTGGPYTIAMTDVLVDDYQKTGVALSGSGMTVDLTRVTTVGEGATGVTAQNGIQISSGAGGTVDDCIISGNDYTGDTWTASGLLPIYGASVTVDGFTLDDNQTSIYLIDSDGSFANGSVTNPTGDALYAYNTGAKEGGGPLAASPFDEGGGGRDARATMTATFTNSTFTGTGATDSWGPSAYVLGGHVDFTVTGCTVTGWDWGVIAYEDGGTVASTVTGNSIYGNTSYGFYTNAIAKATQDASGNWWGHASGPGGDGPGSGDAVAGAVDYSPWYADMPGTTPMPYGTDDSIQDAIDAAVAGSVITVGAGTYDETPNVNKPLTLIGDSGAKSYVYITGGMTLAAGLDGFTMSNFYITGAGAGSSIIRMLGAVSNLTMTGCVLDGELVSGRNGFSGGQLEQNATISGCEFKEILGWALFESRSGSGGGGSPLAAIVFADNYIHDSNGSVVFRGDEANWTDDVDIYGNTWTNIGGNGGVVGDAWAAFEVNRAEDVDIYDNVVTGVSEGSGGEGEAAQLWDITDLYVHNNVFNDNWQGIWVAGDPSPGGVIEYNSIAGNTDYGMKVDGTGTPFDAEMNWWGDASGPATSKGTGDKALGNIDYDPWIGKDPGGENIVCVSDPTYLDAGTPTKTVDVNYLGGGGGLMYGYSLVFTWDGTVAHTSCHVDSVTQGTLLSGEGTTLFNARRTGDNEITVDCLLLGAEPGVSGPGTMFSIEFTGLAVGTSDIGITIDRIRDNINQTLSGFYEDDGLLIVDVDNPVVTGVLITNDTLATDEYVKDGDTVTITADVSDDDPLFDETNITADLIGFGFGDTVGPDGYSGGEATWTFVVGTCDPADGIVTVTVTATDPIGNTADADDTIISDNTAPTAVTAFDAAPGNQKCDLTWTNGTDDHLVGVEVRRYAEPGEYPQYPWFVLNWPNVDAKYPTDETAGTGVYDGADASYTDGVVPRNIYYYQAFCYDVVGHYGPAATTARDLATNYWLGDISDDWTSWGYDGLVDPYDILLLSGEYGHTNPTNMPGDAECDVGPTVHPDWHRLGLPLPDDAVEFEDAMIFAMNYGVVTATKVVPFLPEEYSTDVLALTLSEREMAGSEVEIALRLEGNSDEVKGVSAAIAYDRNELEFVSARLSDDMSLPLADVFFWSGTEEGHVLVDALVLGTDVTIGGSGDVAVLTFRVVGNDYSLEVESARIRNADNVELDAKLGDCASGGEMPLVFRLVQNAPNPFNPVTKVAYHVPRKSEVTIRVYAVSGRVVTTLVDGVVEAGRHAAVWNGRNDAGESVGSGIYFCTMEAPDFHDSRKMTLLK